MSITENNETFKERGGGDSLDDSFNVAFDVPRTFEVTSDSVTDTTVEVLADPGIPALGATHPSESILEVFNRRAEPKDNENDFTHWFVTVRYRKKSNPDAPEDPDTPIDPTTLPPEISFGFSQYTVPVDFAYDINDAQDAPSLPLENSAGEPFDPAVTQEESNMVIKIRRNEKDEDFDPDIIVDFINTINVIREIVAGVQIESFQGRIRNINADDQFDGNGNKYWQVLYEIEINRRTWVKDILDQGFSTEIPAGNLKRIVDDSTPPEPVTEPRNLDGNGGLNPDAAAAVFIPFITYFDTLWLQLDLPEEQS